MSALPDIAKPLNRLEPAPPVPIAPKAAPHRVARPDNGPRGPRRAIRVCHVMSADLWAGAEVQVATVAGYLARRPDVVLIATLFNDGPLATELRRIGVPVAILSERQLRA